MTIKRKAILCDRDGTLVRDVGYLTRPDQVELLTGAAAGLRQLRYYGYLLVIVSNQSGIGRGLVIREQVDLVNRRVQELLADSGCMPDANYYCPHLREDKCDCRKPKPGLLPVAARDLSIDLSRSWMIGDKQIDIEAGRRASCRATLVDSSKGLAAWRQIVRRITRNGS